MSDEHHDNPYLPDRNSTEEKPVANMSDHLPNWLAPPAEPTPRVKAQLIWSWMHEREEHRLVAVADHTPGYEDEYRIEKLGQDALGEPRWDLVSRWRAGEVSGVVALLVSAIKSLITKAP